MTPVSDYDLIVKIFKKVKFQEDGHWIWTGNKSDNYGMLWSENVRLGAVHRILYKLIVGCIPYRYDLDHLCRTTLCINVLDHIEAVTRSTNVRRGNTRRLRKICKRGHPLTPDNIIFIGSRWDRRCVICYNAYEKARGHAR